MKTLQIFLSLCGIIVLTISCNKEETKAQRPTLKVTYLDDFGKCFFFNNSKSGYVIDSDSLYQEIGKLNKVSYFVDCDTVKLPSIDFTKNTLLGIQTGTTQCDSLSRSVIVDTVVKKYIYTINIIHFKELCSQELKVSMNWVLIPKVPYEYKVEFDVTAHN